MTRPLDTEGFWSDPDGDEWYVRLLWDRIEGRVECVGLELRSVRLPGDDRGHGSPLNVPAFEEVPDSALGPDDRNRRVPVAGWKHPLGAKPLTAKLLSRLRFGELVTDTKRQQSQFHQWWAEREKERRRWKRRIAAEWAPSPGKRGRKRVSVEMLAEVAKVYTENPARPQKAVAEALHVTEPWAARLIRRAREAGIPMPSKKEGNK